MKNTSKISINNIRAISFDLDDTLYNNNPVIENAYQKLFNFLLNKYPDFAKQYNFADFLQSGRNVKQQNNSVVDLNILRRLHIQQTLNVDSYRDPVVEEAFNVYWLARQEVDLYPGVIEVLQHLSNNLPLVAISNGNASIKAIGIGRFFQFSITVANTGMAKPDSSMFLLACKRLQIEPVQLLHIGDSIELDIKGALQAGCRCIFFNKNSIQSKHQADAEISDIRDLLSIDLF